MTLRPVLNSARASCSLALLLLYLSAIAALLTGVSAQAAAPDDPSNKRWTPADLADGVEAAIARVTSAELSTRYIERRNTNAYGKGDAVFASGTGRSLFRADGTRWYCDDDGFTTRMGKSVTSPVRTISGFDGTVHFEKNRHVVTYGEDNLSVWQYSPARVFWGAGRDTDFLLGRLRDENAKVVSDETVDGRHQVTVMVAWNWGETAYEYQVTLLPNHSFLPIEATVTVNGNLDAEWSTSGLKQTDGLWYPSKVSRKRFVGTKPDRDRRTIVTTFQLRDNFDDAEFQLGSTIGLDIVDRRAGTAFHNAPWWHDLAPFLRQQLDWPQRDFHSANDYAKYGNDDLTDKLAPQLSVAEWINGEPTELIAEGRHLTLLIFFGGRAISPSPRTLAALNNLRNVYHRNGLEIIGVASASDTLDLTRRDVKSLQLSFPIAIDRANDNPDGNRYGRTFDAYGLKSYYGFFLIDGEGKVLKLQPSRDLLNDIGRMPGIGGDFDLRTNVIRVLYDAGERDLDYGETDLLELNLPQIKVIEPEWKRLLKKAPRTAKLTGTITDGENPIAGATIEAIPTLKLLFSFSPGGYFLSVDRDQRVTLTTDNDGNFDVGGLPKGVWQLTISKPGHASLERNVTLETAVSVAELNIENKQQDHIYGRVLDQKGDPVPRANVKVDKRHPDPERPAITTTAHLARQPVLTDDEGRFEITQLYDGTYTLVIDAANFESATEPHVAADGKEVIIRLKPTPPNDAQAHLTDPDGSNEAISLTMAQTTSRLPFAGLAQIAEILPEATPPPLVEEPAGPRTISGIVTDEVGRPLPGAIAAIQPHFGPPAIEATATADKAGRFTIQLPDSFFPAVLQRTATNDRLDWPVTIWAPGRLLATQSVTLTKSRQWRAELPPIELRRGSDIAIRVLSPTDEVVAGAIVRIDGCYLKEFHALPQLIQNRLTATCGEDGIVRFTGLVKPQMWLNVSIQSEAFGVQSGQYQIRSLPELPVDLRFVTSGTVEGRIRCSSTDELARLKLEVTTETNIPFGDNSALLASRRRSSRVVVSPDAEGCFKVRNMTPGRLTVRQIIDPASTWRLKPLPLVQTVALGKVTEFAAELLPGTRVMGFVIDNENGNLLAESTVEVHELHSPLNNQNDVVPVPLSTVADGRFQGVFLPGHYQITAKTMIPGFSRIKLQRLEVQPDQEMLEVKLFVPRTLSMQAELVDDDGLPVGDAWVAAMSGKQLLNLKRASDIGVFEAWLADVSRADSWQVRIGKRRLSATVVNKVPLKLQVSLKPSPLRPLETSGKAAASEPELTNSRGR